MALVDPYSPVPVRQRQEVQVVLSKAEPYVEKSKRLAENGQYDTAISALDEGLDEGPREPLAAAPQGAPPDRAAEARGGHAGRRRRCSSSQPDHLGAAVLQTRFALAGEGPVAAAAAL